MTAYQRVVAALTCQQPDRVPVLLLMTLQGAQELDVPLPEYLRDPAAMAEGQTRLQARYGHDCVYAFSYGAAEAEAFGGRATFYPDSPPVVCQFPVLDPSDISRLRPPEPNEAASLARTLELIRALAARVKGKVPILANVVGAFSLPIMLMGMDQWLRLLLFGDPKARERTLDICGQFCANWAKAQLAAGADAIAYFDPMSSTDITTPDQFRRYGLPMLRSVREQVNGPLVFATAGGRSAVIAPEVAAAGAAGLVVSAADDLARLKTTVAGKMALAGNLNNIAMASWQSQEAERQVRRCLAAGGPGGGFLLCDQHGELPWEVSSQVLLTVVRTAHQWGQYPLRDVVPGP